jgi:site-specific recombinase XerD
MDATMQLELVWPEGRVVPVPLKEDYHLHTHLFGFLVMRYYYPRDIRLNMTPVTGGSLRQIAYDLKAFLEALAHNGIEYTEADFSDHIEKIVEAQLGTANPTTYNARITRIRDFYDYLQKQGVRVKARFPARTVQRRSRNEDDNFLSHTAHGHSTTYEKDDSHKRLTEKTDYKDQVISIDHYGKLYRALKKLDPVYAVLAQVMMQTFLRVADVCEIPLHSNRYNRYLPLWPEFERQGRTSLRYKLLTKRSKMIEIDIYGETLHAIYEDYIGPHYQHRKELFDSSYMKRANATLEFGNIRDKAKRTLPEDILWLTQTGAPVKPYMIEDAFRETGLNVHPHMLRHTGATHMLWNYCQLHKIEPDVRLATMFQEILQEQLGHADLETTRMYIRTIMKLKGRKTMPFIIPGNKEAIDKELAKTIRTDIKDQMARFFEYRAETVEVEK